MELEKKIINEIEKNIGEIQGFKKDLLKKINELIVFQSVMVTEKEKTDRDAVLYTENKLYDFVK